MIDRVDNTVRYSYPIQHSQTKQNTPSSPGSGASPVPSGESTKNENLQPKKCETCSKRKYQDESGDSSVSFQTPTHISPDMAAAAVAAHEREHVVHNAEKAEESGMTAHSTVTIHTAVCPECGRIYVSGGTTKTTYTARQPVQTASDENNKGNFINTII